MRTTRALWAVPLEWLWRRLRVELCLKGSAGRAPKADRAREQTGSALHAPRADRAPRARRGCGETERSGAHCGSEGSDSDRPTAPTLPPDVLHRAAHGRAPRLTSAVGAHLRVQLEPAEAHMRRGAPTRCWQTALRQVLASANWCTPCAHRQCQVRKPRETEARAASARCGRARGGAARGRLAGAICCSRSAAYRLQLSYAGELCTQGLRNTAASARHA